MEILALMGHMKQIMSQAPRFRLFIDQPLTAAPLTLGREQSHYLANVMRARVGEMVSLFNGRDGEWRAIIQAASKNAVTLAVDVQTRPQAAEPDIWLLAAPIKKERIDLVAEKAAELGASALWPVLTRRTNMGRVNTDRLRAHLIEASEQCERLTVPALFDPIDLDKALSGWDHARPLIFLDESGTGAPLSDILADRPAKLAILTGPEGGFDPAERAMLAQCPFARPASLGPRILRAETAALAALSIAQSICGDWHDRPRHVSLT